MEDARCRENGTKRENEWVDQSTSNLQDRDVIRERIMVSTGFEQMEQSLSAGPRLKYEQVIGDRKMRVGGKERLGAVSSFDLLRQIC